MTIILPNGYVRDERGHFVDPGLTKSVIEANFLFGGSLPSGWGTSNSASSIASPAADSAAVAHGASNRGYYRVGTNTTTTATNDTAILYGPQLQTAGIKAAHFEMLGLYWSDSYAATLNASMFFGLASIETTGAGAQVVQGASDTTAQFLLKGVSNSKTDAHYEFRTSGAASMIRSIGLLLIPGTNEMFLTEGGVDNVVDWRRDAALIGGTVRPMAQITALEAVRKSFRFTGFRLTVWQD